MRSLLDRIQFRLLTPGGSAANVAVAAGATSLAVTFSRAEPSTAFGVVAVPSWGTTVSVGSKATTGFTFTFGTAAPGGGGTIDYLTFHQDV